VAHPAEAAREGVVSFEQSEQSDHMLSDRHTQHIRSSRTMIEFQSPNNPESISVNTVRTHRRVMRHLIRHMLSTSHASGVDTNLLEE
jgi:hypothetical protein